tara:strand:- start:14883 stop:15224 length:342 start_codon:yes stop_codon:yes gene_type:complete
MPTYKQQYNKKYGFKLSEGHTLKEISDKTGYTVQGLKTIYKKGMGAFNTNPQSVRKHIKTPEAWGMSRVYASINPKSKSYQIDKSHLKLKKKKVKSCDCDNKYKKDKKSDCGC